MKDKEQIAERNEYFLAKIARALIKIFWLFPVKDDQIFCVCGTGRGYYDSPKYIAAYLAENHPGKFRTYFTVPDPGAYSAINTASFVKTFSLQHFYRFCTSKVIVTTGGMPTYMPKRKKQYVINTWHGGGAYKRSVARTRYRILMNKYKSKCLDLFVSSCKGFSDIVVPDLVPDYSGEIFPCGMPRNDIFFSPDQHSIREKVCQALHIDSQCLLALYAPTYRGWFEKVGSLYRGGGSDVAHEYGIDVSGVSDALRQRFGKDTVFIFRQHGQDSSERIANVVDASAYPDVQELLCAADVLVSDYSSLIWDFSLTKKPCFLFVPDLDYYLNEDRGVYTPVESWPGIMARSNSELAQVILDYDAQDYAAKVEKHHRDLGSYETGTACRQVCGRIHQICTGGEER